MKKETEKIVYIPTQLAEIWIDEEARQKHRNDIAFTEGWFNNQLREAIQKEELPFILSLIKKLTKSETAVYDLMYAKYDEYIKGNSFIPKVEKERVKQYYIDIADRLKDVCCIAHNYLQMYKFTLIQEKEDSICFDTNQVEEYINSIGIRTFSDKERQYVDLLDKATKALVDVANFEREHGLNEYALRGFALIPKHDDPLNVIAYPCGLAHDARLGFVNTERIIKGLLNV